MCLAFMEMKLTLIFMENFFQGFVAVFLLESFDFYLFSNYLVYLAIIPQF